jgi:ACT domain-containing protein
VPARFLTAEDVRRAGAGPQGTREIVVDASTVVTPQALEAAQGAGIAIRTASGPYEPPAPDRGPDAERARRALPGLPEPAPDAESGGEPAAGGATVVVTAVGKNRHGVLAEIANTINATGGDVESVSQRVVAGYFHLILIVHHEGPGAFGELKRCLECLGGPDDYVVHVMHERVYRFMHRV